ncbi:hypothetical protein V6N12_011334 [Hibiscus sabdariffa]|uniref:Endonuclease/exonuclease/phosphatase domain-containing protein n=1 Tax=Hibiscus sabdariffa TaxID=183260 RepID=A0ABR2B2X8_9ROSI
MAILAWNARGLGNVDTIRGLKDVISKFQPCLVFISETKNKKKYVEKLQRSNKLCQGFYVDPIGIAEIVKNGTALLFMLLHYHEEKKEFWEEMAGLRGQQACKWCVIRDSNSIVNQGEKNGGDWSFLYPKAIGIMEAATTFDHNPILLLLNGPKKKRKKIKDENGIWVEDEGKIVEQSEKHFANIYSKDHSIDMGGICNLIPNVISEVMNRELCKEVNEEEIRVVVLASGL